MLKSLNQNINYRLTISPLRRNIYKQIHLEDEEGKSLATPLQLALTDLVIWAPYYGVLFLSFGEYKQIF